MTVATLHSDLLSSRDLRFLIYEWLALDELPARERFVGQTTEMYDDVLELAERIASERFAPHNRASDAAEPSLQRGRVVLRGEVAQALSAYSEAGLMAATLDESVGGMQLPMTLALAAAAWFQAANASTFNYALLTTAAANMLAAVGSTDQIQRWVAPMAQGRFFGTMCLTEPQAGSSLADITTRATSDGDGRYRLFGSKMWISGGEHDIAENIVHMVLARISDGPAGVKGISLFIVPRKLLDEWGKPTSRNDVTLVGLNHKMGQRGTVNTALSFGDGTHQPEGRPGAIGYLVGEPNRGLEYMFAMMNEARIAVGLASAALAYTAYLKSLRYARERPQGRTLGERDRCAPQTPIINHPDVRRMLLAQKAYAEGGLALALRCGRLSDDRASHPKHEARERARLLLEILTPIAKSWPAQWCLEANSLAVQVHGGYGYSREYDVEQHYRDNRLNAIHEGTHGIQALDLLDRKTRLEGGAALDALLHEIRTTIDRCQDRDGEAVEFASALRLSTEHLESVTRHLNLTPEVPLRLSNASLYLEAAGHIVMAWIWLEQYLAVPEGARDDFYMGKRQVARYFYVQELPRSARALTILEALDRTALDMHDEWF